MNPIIPGFHPDPTICRVGDDYYLANSSFECFPGIPLFHSRDLMNWEQIGHVLTRREQYDPEGVRPSGGIYAPTLRHHDGLFWLVVANVSQAPGQLLFTAPEVGGPWSDPTCIQDAEGIDPDLAWDDNGVCWLSWSGHLPGDTHGILQAKLDTATGNLFTEPRAVWHGTGGQYPEGPHLYRIDGWWYLLIAEGGTERGHMTTIARAHSPAGPFEPGPANPVLTARSTDSPVQNTGHADLVQRPDGTWAAVFLGVRPRGATPSWHILGRETFAREIEWLKGWPVVGDWIEPSFSTESVTSTILTEGKKSEPSTNLPAFSETLSSPILPQSWVCVSAYTDVLRHHDGIWHLEGSPESPIFVGRRQEHFHIRVTAVIKGGALELRMDPRHRVSVKYENGTVRAEAMIGGHRIPLSEAKVAIPVELELRTEVPAAEPGTVQNGPDEIVAGYLDATGFRELGRLDGRYLSTEVAGGFTGRFVGVSTEGSAEIASFRYMKVSGTDF
jgi:beta-xylosidase